MQQWVTIAIDIWVASSFLAIINKTAGNILVVFFELVLFKMCFLKIARSWVFPPSHPQSDNLYLFFLNLYLLIGVSSLFQLNVIIDLVGFKFTISSSVLYLFHFSFMFLFSCLLLDKINHYLIFHSISSINIFNCISLMTLFSSCSKDNNIHL